MNTIRRFLDRTTMYRLILYFMLALMGWAVVASALGLLPYNPWELALQTFLFIALCRGCNELYARLSNVAQNPESAIITGLILSAIIGPLSLSEDWWVLLVASGAAIASKYVFAIRRSHIFNPAAFGAVVAGFLGYSASWWIGSAVTLPLVLIGGLFIMHKIRRLHMIAVFLLVYTILVVLDTLAAPFGVSGVTLADVATLFNTVFISSPILFFSFVMLVEPLTSPQTKRKRIYFGAFVGALIFIPQWFFDLTWFFIVAPFSLELALLVGNIFSRSINPDFRQTLILRRKEMLSPDLGAFWFEPTRPFSYLPGQFLEYTLAHPQADARGIRRYFTIASAPHEGQILLTTRFAEPSSSFKKALRAMKEGDELIASKVAGEFVLPEDKNKKLVFIAGGIGITPFRSMVKHLLEKNEHRDIVLFYAAREERDLVFRDLFEEAKKISMRNVYILSEMEKLPPGWNGRTGRLDANVIEEELPDAKERLFYISGLEPMVKGVSDMLIGMGIPRNQILRDYFPGYALD